VHEGAFIRQLDHDHRVDRPGAEEAAREHLDSLGRGSLAHPDHHAAVADDRDVTTLDGGGVVGQGVVAVEERRRPGEHRVEVVDDPGVDRLAPAGWLGHRVDRHAIVDPGRIVSLKKVIGQRAQKKIVRAEVVHQ
jgi:hypothetical protein